MKKILVIVFVSYILITGIIFYFVIGPDLFLEYKTLQWNGIDIKVPENFKVNRYQSKNWDVYSLQRNSTLIRIATKPFINIFRLSEYEKNVPYEIQSKTGEPSTCYVVKERKLYTIVYATNVREKTIYISVSSFMMSVAQYTMDKLLDDIRFEGVLLKAPELTLPLKLYFTDLIFLGSFTLALIIIVPVMYFAGKKPNMEILSGEYVLCEEGGVSVTFKKGFSRSNNFCYLVLTNSRLLIYYYKRLKMEVKFREENSELWIRGKKIYIKKDNMEVILKPSDISLWKPNLDRYLIR
jgi:hypothetical protein